MLGNTTESQPTEITQLIFGQALSKVTYCANCGCLVGAPVNPCLGTDSNGQHQWVTTEPNGGIVFCVRCGAAAGGATNPCPGTDSNGYHQWEVQI